MKVKELSLFLGAKRSINWQSASADVGVVVRLEKGEDADEVKKKLHEKVHRWLDQEVWTLINRARVLAQEREEKEKKGIHVHGKTRHN